MKLVCEADEQCYVEIADSWTRKEYRNFTEALFDHSEALAEWRRGGEEGERPKADIVHNFYRDKIRDCRIVDVDGKEWRGVDACLGIDFEAEDIDIAVEIWWGGIITSAYQERMQMGNAKRLS